ncbi:hypothetical protein D3C84_965080 [compost metagenome]
MKQLQPADRIQYPRGLMYIAKRLRILFILNHQYGRIPFVVLRYDRIIPRSGARETFGRFIRLFGPKSRRQPWIRSSERHSVPQLRIDRLLDRLPADARYVMKRNNELSLVNIEHSNSLLEGGLHSFTYFALGGTRMQAAISI